MTRIRRATAADALVLLDLQRQCLDSDAPLGFADASHWWLAFDAGRPVGFAAAKRSHRWTDAWYFSRAGVLPTAQGQGLQKRLIRARLRAAKAAGMAWAITDTTLDNAPSINSLIGCGFKSYRPLEPWALRRSIYWRKDFRCSP